MGSGAAPCRLSGKLRLRSCRAGQAIGCHSIMASIDSCPDRVQQSSRSTWVQLARHRLFAAHCSSVASMQDAGCSSTHIAGPAARPVAKPASDIHGQLTGHVAPVLQAAVKLTSVHKPVPADSESGPHWRGRKNSAALAPIHRICAVHVQWCFCYKCRPLCSISYKHCRQCKAEVTNE